MERVRHSELQGVRATCAQADTERFLSEAGDLVRGSLEVCVQAHNEDSYQQPSATEMFASGSDC